MLTADSGRLEAGLTKIVVENVLGLDAKTIEHLETCLEHEGRAAKIVEDTVEENDAITALENDLEESMERGKQVCSIIYEIILGG